MNRNPKRFRQMSLLESFGVHKKHKPNNCEMEGTSGVLEPFIENTEEKVIPSSQPALNDSLEICQAVEDSLKIRNENNVDDAEKGEEPVSEESSLKPSADLFPSEPSQDDHSVPGSSNSSELFNDSTYELQSECELSSSEEEIYQMTILNRLPDCCLPLPKLEPLENHFIMFSPHIRSGDAPRPYPRHYTDKWDSDHVRMPCSPLNRCAIEGSQGEKIIANRWDIICQSLKSDIGSSAELEEAIMSYNSQYIGKWNFLSLHTYINNHLNEEERDHFFETLLPAMVDKALELPKVCTQSVPLLKTHKDRSITLSQKQIGCLLLNAFFCTFPRRTYPNNKKQMRYKWKSEYASYPEINFNRLFAGNRGDKRSRKMEKLKCLINYFKRIITEEPTGTMTFHRQVIEDKNFPLWHSSSRGIRSAVIRSSGLIETDGNGMLQVDFANKYIGGGVIGQGCVQEEIRFIVCPELIVACLFVECLAHNEALIVTGVEQYNKYSGYADSFKWEGDFRDEVPRDSWGRRYTQLVAIDATSFRNPDVQFEFPYVKRELNKAYSGFYENAPPAHLPAVASGNWGCGVFKGNPNLKFVIQLMAASEAGRSLVYFTFGNKKLKNDLQKIYDFLNDKNLTVGDCWRLLMSYSDDASALNSENKSSLCDFFHSQFVTKKDNCKEDKTEEREEQLLNDSDKKAINKLFEDDGFEYETDVKDVT